ncbi:hypothetical protein [Serratia sp. TKO39]|uniref:hypothetical protein n=1 Tax=Serratia sp. TKO39 TaxID=2052589 RepID=UPI000C23FA33|nr:hypothetical protein [Serratia sp. TKO39]PJI66998.1 hypothetical protein CUN64_17445 [Serratia sp. TKO39]
MTLTTEQLRARAESLGLDFFIERRAGIWVKEWLNDGCTSATSEEVLLWSMLANREAQPVAATPIYQIWDDDGWCDTDEQIWRDTYDDFRKEQYRIVYTAPPAPAVPEEMTGDGVLAMHDCGYIEGWNACRAAMLAAAPEGGNG